MARAPILILNGLGQQVERAGVDSGDGSIAELAQLINPDGTDLDLKGLLTTLQRADVVCGATPLALNSTANYVGSPVGGQGTASFEIGTAGVALGGAAVGTFEVQRTSGGTWTAVYGYPMGGGYRAKTTAVGGVFTVETAGCVAVRFRVSTTGTGSVNVAINLGGLARLLATVPVQVGQTTRAYDWTNGQRVAFTGTDATSSPIAANEVLLHAKTNACWVRVDAVASATAAASLPLEAGEKFHMQITPGDVIHVVQDSAAGTLIIVPVA
ncbi:MAG: hypothetical protein JO290_12875 [Sphingomonadaceae bacterium]|nr:hypothetical protein [Sphingomonadaceae bacterium]